MTNKRIQGWVWTRNEGKFTSFGNVYHSEEAARRHTPFMYLSNGYRLVRLVEYDPAEQGVVRAAVDVVAWHDPEGRPRALTLSEADQRLRRAVERMQKGKKR